MSRELTIGVEYWGIPTNLHSTLGITRGTYVGTYINVSGYTMRQFKDAYYTLNDRLIPTTRGTLISRKFEPHSKSIYTFYPVQRFSQKLLKNIRMMARIKEIKNTMPGLYGSWGPEGKKFSDVQLRIIGQYLAYGNTLI